MKLIFFLIFTTNYIILGIFESSAFLVPDQLPLASNETLIKITKEEVEEWESKHMQKITTRVLNTIKPELISVLNPYYVRYISNGVLVGLDADRVKHFTIEQIRSLTANQIKEVITKLDEIQLKLMPWMYLSIDILKLLTPDQLLHLQIDENEMILNYLHHKLQNNHLQNISSIDTLLFNHNFSESSSQEIDYIFNSDKIEPELNKLKPNKFSPNGNAFEPIGIKEKIKQNKKCKKLNEDSLRKNVKKNNGSRGATHIRIIGGWETKINNWPFMLSLEKKYSWRYAQICGASILTYNWAITAAHCFLEGIAARFYVRAGSTVKERGGYLHRINRIIIHPHFKLVGLDIDYDIAVLQVYPIFRIHQGIEFDKQQRVRMSYFVPKENTLLYVLGWGNTVPGIVLDIQTSFPDALRVVKIKMLNFNRCNSYFKKYRTPISARMLCAGDWSGGKDSCVGDSGGPLIDYENGRLVGIVSFGRDCGLPGHPGVYTSIPSVSDWIRQITGAPND